MAAQYLWITEAKRKKKKKQKKEEREWHFLYLEAGINFSKHSRPLQTSAPPLMFLIGGVPLIRTTATRLQAANAFITWITAGATKALGCHWPAKEWMQNCDSHPGVGWGCAVQHGGCYLTSTAPWKFELRIKGTFWSIGYLEAIEHVGFTWCVWQGGIRTGGKGKALCGEADVSVFQRVLALRGFPSLLPGPLYAGN